MRQLTQQEYDSLVALAKFGSAILQSCDGKLETNESPDFQRLVRVAMKMGLIELVKPAPQAWQEKVQLTDLAQLPEAL